MNELTEQAVTFLTEFQEQIIYVGLAVVALCAIVALVGFIKEFLRIYNKPYDGF